jgi:hypothetical protein
MAKEFIGQFFKISGSVDPERPLARWNFGRASSGKADSRLDTPVFKAACPLGADLRRRTIRQTLPHRGANLTNLAISGNHQCPESLDFRESPKGSNPFCPCAFQGGSNPLER